jgi:N-acetylglucosamine kinase-like BadF-type ATPase
VNRYYLGADVGATKTHVLIADQDGLMVGFGESGPGNHEAVGFDGLSFSLIEATDWALAAANIKREMISGAGFGVAGYDWPSEREPTLQAIQALGLKSTLAVVNDTILGLIAGSPQGWGIAVVSGTGCNCWGWDQDHMKEGRVVGRSSLVGEAAGGTELIEKVVQAIAYEWTQRGPHTELTPAILTLTGARSLADFLEGFCEEKYKLNSSAAQLVFQVAAEGDPVANDIIQWAGRELGELARAVIRQLEFEALEFDTVLVGSMFDGGPILIEPMRQTIQALAPGARLLRLKVPPVVGAVLLGMDVAGCQRPDAIHGTLVPEPGLFTEPACPVVEYDGKLA